MSALTYLEDRITKKKCRLNGIRPSKRLPNKASLQGKFSNHVRISAQQLPPKVNLRYAMTPVEDQSSVGSCVANSFAGAYEYLLKKTTGQHIDVSRLFIYYNARLRDEESEDDITDSGCTATSAIESLEELGTCSESIWPYDVDSVDTPPSDEAYEAAKNHRIIDALQLNVDLYEMKACLAQGFPFVFGLSLFKSFDKARKKGFVPMPKASEKSREAHGQHSMLAVGYSDHSRVFIVRNSWGEDWGDGGYCYIPYDYMTDEQFCHGTWAVRALETDDMGHDYWDEADDIDYTGDDDDEEADGEEEEEQQEEEE